MQLHVQGDVRGRAMNILADRVLEKVALYHLVHIVVVGVAFFSSHVSLPGWVEAKHNSHQFIVHPFQYEVTFS